MPGYVNCSELCWREVQRIKSEGDFSAGKKLVEEYAVKVAPALHAEVLERYAKLNLAPYKGIRESW